MSSEEQKQILKMVAEGKISAEEAMTLIKALGETPPEAETEVVEASTGSGSGTTAAPELEETAAQARRWAMIPLWIGVAIVILSAYWLFSLAQASNFGFWFYCAWLPFLLGLAVVVLAAGSRAARWLFVRVERKRGRPRNIVLGFPLPLGLTAWFLRTFGHRIRDLERTNVDEILQALEKTTSSKSPLIVNVQDNEDGEHVQVYIG